MKKKCCNNCAFLDSDKFCSELSEHIRDTYWAPANEFEIDSPEKFVCPSFSLKKKLNKKRPDEV